MQLMIIKGENFIVRVGNFLPLMLISLIRHTKSESDLCLYTRNLKNERL